MSTLNTAQSSPAKSQSSAVSLLDLPYEIQHEIYKQVLPYKSIIATRKPTGVGGRLSHSQKTSVRISKGSYRDFTISNRPDPADPDLDLSLLLTCRQVYVQASEILYRGNKFQFAGLYAHCPIELVLNFLHKLRPESRQFLQHLEVYYLLISLPERGILGLSAHRNSQRTAGAKFAAALSSLCSLVGTLKNLRRLGLGISMEFPLIIKKGLEKGVELEEIAWVQPLVGLCKPDCSSMTIILATVRSQDAAFDELLTSFMAKLVEAMRANFGPERLAADTRVTHQRFEMAGWGWDGVCKYTS